MVGKVGKNMRLVTERESANEEMRTDKETYARTEQEGESSLDIR